MVDTKKAKQVEKEKRRHAKQVRKGEAEPDDAARQAARQAKAAKTDKDREQNRAAQQRANQKAIAAQIIQLIERHRIDHQSGDIGYQFVDGKKIKKLHVSVEQQRQLERGHIAVVRLASNYELVPAAVAEKIEQRDPATVVLINCKRNGDSKNSGNKQGSDNQSDPEEDPYADFKVPDDLMW